MHYDHIEQEIREALEKIPGRASNWGETEWTRNIKNELAKLGKKHRYHVYARDYDGVNGGEWLFDMTWLEYSEKEFLLDIPIVSFPKSEPHPKAVPGKLEISGGRSF